VQPGVMSTNREAGGDLQHSLVAKSGVAERGSRHGCIPKCWTVDTVSDIVEAVFQSSKQLLLPATLLLCLCCLSFLQEKLEGRGIRFR